MPASTMQPVLGAHDTLVCPDDGYAFRPYYSDGVCPLCAWAPQDAVVAQPWSHRVDWLVVAFVVLVVAATAMTFAVLNRL